MIISADAEIASEKMWHFIYGQNFWKSGHKRNVFQLIKVVYYKLTAIIMPYGEWWKVFQWSEEQDKAVHSCHFYLHSTGSPSHNI